MTPTAAASTTTSSATTATLSAKLTVRRVTFDWADTPLHWIPGDPQSSHTINVLHILLPAGERWFCRVYREALPLVTGDALRSDVKGFIGQEAVHARAHTSAVEWLGRQGIDATAFSDELERLANDRLGK